MLFVHPFTNLTRQTISQIILLIVGLYGLCNTFIYMVNLERYGVQSFRSLRIDLESTDAWTQLDSIELLRMGCTVYRGGHVNITAPIDFPDTVDIDGYALNFAPRANRSGQLGFTLLGSTDSWATRRAVGSSVFLYGTSGILFLGGTVPLAVPRLSHDLRPPPPLIFQTLADNFLFSLLLLVSAACGRHRPGLGRRASALLLLLDSAVCTAAVPWHLSLGLRREAPTAAVFAAAYLSVALTLAFAQTRLGEAPALRVAHVFVFACFCAIP